MANLKLTGTVTGIRGPYLVVDCPLTSPAVYPQFGDVNTLYISHPHRKDAKTGDRVTLEYFSTSSYGLWAVTEVTSA